MLYLDHLSSWYLLRSWDPFKYSCQTAKRKNLATHKLKKKLKFMLNYPRVHDLEDWSQHCNGRGLICAPSSLHLGIFIQLIFFLHNSSTINGTYSMILSICLVKIQYSLVLRCQFSVSPSLDAVPTGQNCSGKWLLWPPTVKLSRAVSASLYLTFWAIDC